MWSRATKGDYLLLASLIALGVLTILSAVAITRSVTRNALADDARQLAMHWAAHVASHLHAPGQVPLNADHSHALYSAAGVPLMRPAEDAAPAIEPTHADGAHGAIGSHGVARTGLPSGSVQPSGSVLNDAAARQRIATLLGNEDPRDFHSGRHVGMIYRYVLFDPQMRIIARDGAIADSELKSLYRTPAFAADFSLAAASQKPVVATADQANSGPRAHITRAFVPMIENGKVGAIMVVDLDQSASFTLLGSAFNIVVLMMAALMVIGIAVPVFAVWRRIRSQLELQTQVDFMALHDPLTSLPNRTQFTGYLKTALDNAARNRSSVALLCADIDRFREINDTLGHPAGDAVLVAVASRFREATISCDAIAARLGGDEFAIAIQGENARENALMLARILRDGVTDADMRSKRKIATTISIGMAVGPGDGADALVLLKHADMALNRAKSAGAGSTRLYVPSMETETQSRYALERDLAQAIEANELELLYQPQVDLLSGQVTGYEALLRWQHSRRGNVSPDEFIACAEESGLIDQIGNWVLRTACRAAAAWPEPLTLAVNVSATQFMKGDIVDTVETVLQETGLDPRRLEIEITESLLLHNIEKVQNALGRLNTMGISIALDDFGTGYSSLSYLARFAFQKIKIDRSFVSGLGTTREAAAVIKAIVGLGHALDVTVIAEGVETEEQMRALRAAGCNRVQGYLYGKPEREILEPWAATVTIARNERRMSGTA